MVSQIMPEKEKSDSSYLETFKCLENLNQICGLGLSPHRRCKARTTIGFLFLLFLGAMMVEHLMMILNEDGLIFGQFGKPFHKNVSSAQKYSYFSWLAQSLFTLILGYVGKWKSRNISKISWLEKIDQYYTNIEFAERRDSQQLNGAKMQTLRKWSRAIFWIVLLSIIAYSVPHFIFFVTGPSHNSDKVEFIIWSVINFLWGTISSVINQSAIGQFVFVTKTINLTYCNITKQLKGLANGYLTGQQLSDQLIRLQLRHNMATKFLASANQFWKWYLFNFYLTSVPVCIGLTYTLITKFKGNEIVLIWVIGNLLAIVIVSSFAAKVANEATKPYGEIYDILGMPMDDDTKKQMTIFMNRLSGPSIGFTLLDIVVVNNQIITSVASVMITYLVILIQFREN